MVIHRLHLYAPVCMRRYCLHPTPPVVQLFLSDREYRGKLGYTLTGRQERPVPSVRIGLGFLFLYTLAPGSITLN
jgi:hypothetical protein